MTGLPYLDADAIAAISWPATIDAIGAACTARTATDPPRTTIAVAAGQLLLMPATTATAAGIKIVSIAPANAALGRPRIQGVYVLFDAATLTPRALFDGAALTTRRTPAVSAFAVNALAPTDASRLLVFGCGPQAEAHVHAINSIRPLDQVSIVGRDHPHAQALADRLGTAGFTATATVDPDPRAADIVVCATTARLALFNGDALAANACVVAIGSHEPSSRELDDRAFRRATRIVVEDVATALREAGDVIGAIAADAIGPEDLIDLPQIGEMGPSPGVSIFKSVGMAWQDLAVAQAVIAAQAISY